MNKKVVIFCTVFLLIIGLAVSLSYRAPVMADTTKNSDKPIISVTGEGVLNATPNRAKIVLAVVTENTDIKKAQQENNKRANELIKTLKTYDIEPEDMKTQNFYINPIYNYDSKNPDPKITGYRVQNEVHVTIKNIDNIGTIINASVNAGANKVNNIHFYIEDDKIKEQVLRASIQDAKKKAEIIADELGKSIIGIVKVSGGWSNIAPIPVRYNIMEDSLTSSSGSYNTPIIPGETEIKASVQIEFEMSR